MVSLKELSRKKELISAGHRACAGCPEPIAVRQILMAADSPVVVCCPTGCLEVTTTIFPYTAWRTPWIHSAFENAAATISGVETAYRALKKRGRIEDKVVKFIAIGGDGGTFDIGFQSLSGAMERGHDLVYICLNNEAYMNTGIQRSSATPRGAHTTTSPAGKAIPGKVSFRKDLTACIVAHGVPYVAQTTTGMWKDLVNKVKKALAVDGPAFINVLVPCPLGWGFPPDKTIEMAQLAVECNFWPLYEVEDGRYQLTYRPKEVRPLMDWLKLQIRFRHLFKPENEGVLKELLVDIDKSLERLLGLCELH